MEIERPIQTLNAIDAQVDIIYFDLNTNSYIKQLYSCENGGTYYWGFQGYAHEGIFDDATNTYIIPDNAITIYAKEHEEI